MLENAKRNKYRGLQAAITRSVDLSTLVKDADPDAVRKLLPKDFQGAPKNSIQVAVLNVVRKRDGLPIPEGKFTKKRGKGRIQVLHDLRTGEFLVGLKGNKQTLLSETEARELYHQLSSALNGRST